MRNHRPDLAEIHCRSNGKLSDKWDLYLEVYNRLFSEWREQPINLLEIGVQNGGSLETWAQYFSSAHNLVGCDIDKECACLTFDDPRIHVIIGDATDSATVQKIEAVTDSLDIVIEDGSHTSRDIVRSFAEFFPKLRPGGVYIAEDLHCCYWSEWGGGLCRPDSGMEFFKALCDCVNSGHWHRQDIGADEYINSISNIHGCSIDQDTLQNILSIEFYDSMCVIRRASSGSLSRIKERTVGGYKEQVVEGFKSIGHSMPIFPQTSNRPKSLLDAVCELDRLSSELSLFNHELDRTRAELDRTRAELDISHAMLNQLIGSLSWRLTRPIRASKRLIYRILDKLKRYTSMK
jgi:SAM-dependent methyltransferase